MPTHRLQYFILTALLLIITGCAASNKVYYPEKIAPYPTVQQQDARQAFVGYPPLFRPEKKRRTIIPGSQHFKLAIPNAVDMSGRAQDLQRSLADILYTELFKMKRFDLLDRGELTDVDPEWLTSSLKKTLISTSNNSGKGSDNETAKKGDVFEQAFTYFKGKEEKEVKIKKKLRSADGVLLVYITSRKGTSKGGAFTVDYRIVGNNHNVVLFADSQSIKYSKSSTQEVAYNRKDIIKITSNIYSVFPNPKKVINHRIINRDMNSIVIDAGDDKEIKAGLTGYVVQREDNVRHESQTSIRHYVYLGEFVITQVFEHTSTGLLFNRETMDFKGEWDVEEGDEIIIK